MTDYTKHQQLVNSISAHTTSALRPLFDAVRKEATVEFANLNTNIAAILARFEFLERGDASIGVTKRALRGERKIGGAVASITEVDSGVDFNKVTNTMLYCRRMMADSKAFRDKYVTKAFQDMIDADEKTMKHAEGSEGRYLAQGYLFWRKFASEDQKVNIRAEYRRWDDIRKREAIDASLAIDTGDEIGIEGTVVEGKVVEGEVVEGVDEVDEADAFVDTFDKS